MNNFNEEYYVIIRENNNKYPTFNGWIMPRSLKKIKVEENTEHQIWLTTGHGNGKHNEYVDYHSSGGQSVCSKEFADLILSFETGGIQFLKGTHGDVVEEVERDYYMMHFYNRIACVEREKSNIEINPETNFIRSIRGFSINEEVLNKIPFEKRQIFFLDESAFIKLFHESIVEKMMNSGLKGFRFIKASQWGDNSAFN